MLIEKMYLWEEVPGLCEEIPYITWYIPENKTSDGAVVIFPGGAYYNRAKHEGRGYAEFLCNNGITAFVVDYRVTPHKHPLPLLDARRAIQFVRFYSEKYGIDKDKVFAMGSSAGGHLVATLCNDFFPTDYELNDEISKTYAVPDGHILCYPVINMDDESIAHEGSGRNLLGDKFNMYKTTLSMEKRVSKYTSKAFIWHTADDSSVNVLNSINYANALKKNGVDFELHIFPNGKHGLGLPMDESKESKHVVSWGDLLIKWLRYNDF